MRAALLDGRPQRAAGGEEVLLADDLVERPGTHAGRQRRLGLGHDRRSPARGGAARRPVRVAAAAGVEELVHPSSMAAPGAVPGPLGSGGAAGPADRYLWR